MRPGIQYNCDLSVTLADLITQTSIDWVMEQQPANWLPDLWQRQWRMNPALPHPEVIGELQVEYAKHGKIRRSFVFSYQDRSPAELFIAAMAWGSGDDPRGAFKVRSMLTPAYAAEAIEAVVDTVGRGGAAAGYSKYFADCRLPQLNTAFITKLLYFAGYRGEQRPRPLIYDSRVACIAIRLPDAPLLPSTWDRVSAKSYQRYCEWADQVAADHGTEPVVVEWALFHLGGQVRQQFRT
jgi:hypothetical protein